MKFWSAVSTGCIICGLALVAAVGGLTVYETVTGEPLFDYNLLPDVKDRPVKPAAPAVPPDAAPDSPAAAPEAAPDASARAETGKGPRLPMMQVSTSWSLNGDKRLQLTPWLQDFRSAGSKVFVTGDAEWEDFPESERYMIERVSHHVMGALVVASSNTKTADVMLPFGSSWMMNGDCRALSPVKGSVKVIGVSGTATAVWDNFRDPDTNARTCAGLQLTLAVDKAANPFVFKVIAKGDALAGMNSPNVFFRELSATVICQTPNGERRFRCGSRSIPRMVNHAYESSFFLVNPPENGRLEIQMPEKIVQETAELQLPAITVPQLPYSPRYFPRPGPNEFRGEFSDASGKKLGTVNVTNFNVRRVAHHRSDAEDFVEFTLNLEMPFGGGRAITTVNNGGAEAGTFTATGGAVPGEGKIACHGKRLARTGEPNMAQLTATWKEKPETATDAPRSLAGELPTVIMAEEWGTLELPLEIKDGKPTVPYEKDGIRLTRTSDVGGVRLTYSLPRDKFPAGQLSDFSDGCTAHLLPQKTPARRVNAFLGSRGQMTLELFFPQTGWNFTGVTLKFPSKAEKAKLKFSVNAVPLPYLANTDAKSLF